MTFPKIKYIRPEHLLCQGPVVGSKGRRNDSPDVALWKRMGQTGSGRAWAEPLVRGEGMPSASDVLCHPEKVGGVQRKDSQQGLLKLSHEIFGKREKLRLEAVKSFLTLMRQRFELTVPLFTKIPLIGPE